MPVWKLIIAKQKTIKQLINQQNVILIFFLF